MDLTALQTFVDEEVAALGQGYPKPSSGAPSGDEDEKLGEVPEDLRPLFGRIQELRDQAKALGQAQKAKCAIDICAEDVHAETKAQIELLLEKRDELRDIFWLLFKKRLGISGFDIELKSDWQVVVSQEEEDDSSVEVIHVLGGRPTNLADLMSILSRISQPS